MDEHFGVRVAAEGVSALNQGVLECVVVLDDAVVDEGKLAVTTEVGVGVDVIRWSVCGPTRVSDSDVARGRLVSDVRQQVIHLAFPAVMGQGSSGVQDGDTSTVISAVFKPLEALDDEGKRRLFPEVANDAAHVVKIVLDEGFGLLGTGHDEGGLRGAQGGMEHHLFQGDGGQFRIEVHVWPRFLAVEPLLGVDGQVDDEGVAGIIEDSADCDACSELILR